MANPQPNDAHLRIAHSINEAIMLRDFTKRQRKIMDLILRLSWGCGKKEAHIPHQNDFCVVGIYEPDVKAELTWLEQSKIICRHDNLYWFNKDFDQWQISRVKPFQPERLSKLLSLNLNGVSKTLSTDLVKHEVETSQNTKFSTSELATPKETTKEILKQSVNDIDNKESVLDIYRDLIGEVSEDLENEIELAIKDCTAPWVIDAIREGVKRDRKDWPYIGGILKNWLKNQQLYGNRYGKVSGNRTRSQDPDKYVKGTYGHMTHR